MDQLWFEYERVQLGAGRRLEEEHPEVIGLTRIQEIYAWEDYAIERYMHWIDIPMSANPVSDAQYRKPRADLA